MLRWDSVPGQTYRILNTTNLGDPRWQIDKELSGSGSAGAVRIPLRGNRESYFMLMVE